MNEANLPAIEPVTDEDARVATQSYFINMKHILIHDRRRVAERQAARGRDAAIVRKVERALAPVEQDAIVRRLREISHAITQGPDTLSRECVMRVPPEPDHDADLVLSSAAAEIERLRAEVAAHRKHDVLRCDALMKAEAEVARLTAACAAKDAAIRMAKSYIFYSDHKQHEQCALALATDAGNGWVDASGAVEALASGCVDASCATVLLTVPYEWAGKRVLVMLKPGVGS